jgi:hypothetical protein
MRFAMLINGVESEWGSMLEEANAAGVDPMAEVLAFFERWEKAGKIAHGGAELDSVSTAKTVRAGTDGKPVVTDGPYLEVKEVIGGVTFLEAADIDEAVAIAATWPLRGSTSVEVRPVIEH